MWTELAPLVFTAVTSDARVTISAGAVVCTVASEGSSVMVLVFACVMPLLESVVVTGVSLGASTMPVISTAPVGLDRLPEVPVWHRAGVGRYRERPLMLQS
jgi:hypothetical protein